MKKLTLPLSLLQPEQKDGLVPVYKTVRGKYYISRTSKKTGNYYRKYINFE